MRCDLPNLLNRPNLPQPASRRTSTDPLFVDSQLHIVWMGAAMVDTGLAYPPHAMHTEVS